MDGVAPGRFPYKHVAKYPHMKPEDIMVWDRFIDSHPDEFDTCDYDVPVGTGSPVREDDPDPIQRMTTINSQKKIDVVAYKGFNTFVIEVKPVANARGLGQCLTYFKLYMDEHPLDKNVVPMIVCNEVEREMLPVYEAQGIRVGIA